MWSLQETVKQLLLKQNKTTEKPTQILESHAVCPSSRTPQVLKKSASIQKSH